MEEQLFLGEFSYISPWNGNKWIKEFRLVKAESSSEALDKLRKYIVDVEEVEQGKFEAMIHSIIE